MDGYDETDDDLEPTEVLLGGPDGQRIELTQEILGLEPYILIKVDEFDDMENLAMTLLIGGGVTREVAPAILQLAAEQLQQQTP